MVAQCRRRSSLQEAVCDEVGENHERVEGLDGEERENEGVGARNVARVEPWRGMGTLDDAEAEEESTKEGEAEDKGDEAADDSDDDAGVEAIVGVDVGGYDGRNCVLEGALHGVELWEGCRWMRYPGPREVPGLLDERGGSWRTLFVCLSCVVCLRRRGRALGWRGLCRQAMTHQRSVGTRDGVYSGSTLRICASV